MISFEISGVILHPNISRDKNTSIKHKHLTQIYKIILYLISQEPTQVNLPKINKHLANKTIEVVGLNH